MARKNSITVTLRDKDRTVILSDPATLLDISDRLMQVMKDLKKVTKYKDDEGKNRPKLWPETYHQMLGSSLGRIADSRSDIMAVASMLLNNEIERMAQEDEA